MSFKVQHLEEESKFCHHLNLPLLERYYPREIICELLTLCKAWEQRERKLTQLVVVYYIIALSLFRQCNVTEVFAHLYRGLRWIWPDDRIALPTGGALTIRREQLGCQVMRLLFRRCCRPLATEGCKGAFAFGLRLMALDSTLDEVPDTPANATHFGRVTSGKYQSTYPQVRCLCLAEVGTHAIVDAMVGRCTASEQAMSYPILRSVQPGMLLLTDRNFPSIQWFAAVRQQGAHLLCRIKAGHYTQRSQTLSDGSYLVTLRPKGKGQEPLTLRIIEYRLKPWAARELATLSTSRNIEKPDPWKVHRLITTLLDPQQAPALDLITTYHERWEVELVIDEIKIHQRLMSQPLRSKSPEMLYQELYGTLLAHYAIRAWMYEAARQADLDPDRLSFTHAMQTLDQAFFELAITAKEDQARAQERVLADLRDPKTLLRPRRLRFCPRSVKRLSATFHRKKEWHQSVHWKQTTFRDLLALRA